MRNVACTLGIAIAAIGAAAWAPAASAQQAAAAPAEHTFTGNLAVVSDYRFRGISQTFRRPAVQGGFDYAHSSGFYVGNWNSNVSGVQYPNGASLEMDVYAGYRKAFGDFTVDVGAIQYIYPGAKYTGTNERFDNTEVYIGGAWGPVSAKLYYAVSDYFGLNNTTAGALGIAQNGKSRGTTYIDLTYSQEVFAKTTLIAHVGRTTVRNYGDFSYTDYRVGATYDWNGFLLGAAVVGSDVKTAGEGFYTAINGNGDTKKLWRPTVVVSVGKTF